MFGLSANNLVLILIGCDPGDGGDCLYRGNLHPGI